MVPSSNVKTLSFPPVLMKVEVFFCTVNEMNNVIVMLNLLSLPFFCVKHFVRRLRFRPLFLPIYLTRTGLTLPVIYSPILQTENKVFSVP